MLTLANGFEDSIPYSRKAFSSSSVPHWEILDEILILWMTSLTRLSRSLHLLPLSCLVTSYANSRTLFFFTCFMFPLIGLIPSSFKLFLYLIILNFFSFIFISCRLITLQYCSGFCHTLTWISHGFTCIPILIPPPTSLPIPSLWVFPVHQPWALVSCIQPGLVICFTLDSTLVSMLFSQNIPPSPSPTESKSLFCTSVSLFLFCI